MLLRGLGGIGDGRAPDGEHVGLARDFATRERVLVVLDDRFPVHFFAVVTAAVAGRPEERLPLRGPLLEQEVERLLGSRLSFLLLFLARLAVARGDDLVAVFVHHRRYLGNFVRRASSGFS